MAVHAATTSPVRPADAPGSRVQSKSPRILVVEDDLPLAEGMIRILDGHGYGVVHARSGEEALLALATGDFDAMVLDIGLPGIDGFQVLSQLDPAKHCSVLIVSAYDRVEQRVKGLDLGADDYLVKPFVVEEFEARLRALLRRSQLNRNIRVELAGLAVDVVGKRAWVNEEPLELTAREWSVLSLLLTRAGQVVSKDQLQQTLTSDQQVLSDNAIEVYISRLRGKLAGAGVNIRTLRGFGYMIEEPRAGRS
ncbi:Transcriptional regulatory protein BasR [Rhodocyclaceae bacterium]|nr:Transcriptional regulatory protein BasR [Rhodocyclaceae bacterium]